MNVHVYVRVDVCALIDDAMCVWMYVVPFVLLSISFCWYFFSIFTIDIVTFTDFTFLNGGAVIYSTALNVLHYINFSCRWDHLSQLCCESMPGAPWRAGIWISYLEGWYLNLIPKGLGSKSHPKGLGSESQP